MLCDETAREGPSDESPCCFEVSSIREISILLEIHHPNIVQCREVAAASVLRDVDESGSHMFGSRKDVMVVAGNSREQFFGQWTGDQSPENRSL